MKLLSIATRTISDPKLMNESVDFWFDTLSQARILLENQEFNQDALLSVIYQCMDMQKHLFATLRETILKEIRGLTNLPESSKTLLQKAIILSKYTFTLFMR